jgi:hypothetical protein
MVGYEKNNTKFETVVENNYCTQNPRVWWFLHFLQLFRHKNAPNELVMFWTHTQPNWQQKKFRKFCVFSIFLSIFLKIMFKNNVCVNLTTETSKYRVDVSQLSLPCFSSFLLSLLSRDLEKFIFWVWGRNCKKRPCKVSICFELAFAKFWANLQI